MIAVWTTWTTSGTNNVAASVQDLLGNNYHVAVGPTLQVSSNTAAQIFYATVTSGGSSDPVTVTFTSTVSSAGCVIAEYSGIDQVYPVDSVSSGSSYSAGTAMDSGTVVPASTSILVFGGGTSDSGSITSVPLTLLDSHLGSVVDYQI
jgi:hypothetical protein